MINKIEIEKLLVESALRECHTLTGAAKKIVTLYTPAHKMIKGKHVVGPSLIESAVDKTYDEINANPYA